MTTTGDRTDAEIMTAETEDRLEALLRLMAPSANDCAPHVTKLSRLAAIGGDDVPEEVHAAIAAMLAAQRGIQAALESWFDAAVRPRLITEFIGLDDIPADVRQALADALSEAAAE